MKSWQRMGTVALMTLALTAMGARAEEKAGTGKEGAAKAAPKTSGKSSNKDLYLGPGDGGQTGGTPSAVTQPTIKFWAEREPSTGGNANDAVKAGAAGADKSLKSKGRDIILDDQKTVYRSNDRVWFKFETNVDCFAYLACKGSTGKLTLLYPGMGGRDNKVAARKVMTIPSVGTPFKFDENPGQEQLCLVISPRRISDFEEIAGAGDRGGRALEMSASQEDLWGKGTQDAVELGKCKDLSLEQDAHPTDLETPGNYLTDHGSAGLTRPIKLMMTLRHEP